MVSGSGHVSKEIADTEIIAAWAETLRKWYSNPDTRPKQVSIAMSRLVQSPPI